MNPAAAFLSELDPLLNGRPLRAEVTEAMLATMA
jgi:hypothetical protein